MATQMTLGEMAQSLNRPAVVLSGLQKRFHLPVLKGAAYFPAYFAFLRKIVHLRILGIAEADLLELWKVEKHLLQLLHLDTATGSPTWFLDECTQGRNTSRRLLLSHTDLGPGFLQETLQPHLDFAPAPRALFSHKEAGDDVIKALKRYRGLTVAIQTKANAEAAQLRHALHWFPRVRPPRPKPPPKPEKGSK